MPGTRPLTEVFRLMCNRFPGRMAVTMAAVTVAGFPAARPFATPAGDLPQVERSEEAMGSMFGLVCAAQRSRRMPKASGAWNVG
jgi:hypothetical protein